MIVNRKNILLRYQMIIYCYCMATLNLHSILSLALDSMSHLCRYPIIFMFLTHSFISGFTLMTLFCLLSHFVIYLLDSEVDFFPIVPSQTFLRNYFIFIYPFSITLLLLFSFLNYWFMLIIF